MIRTFISDRWYRVAVTPEGVPEYKTSLVEPFPPQLAPEDVSEANLPPGKFGTYTFDDFSEGFGQSITPTKGSNKRYDRIGDNATAASDFRGVDCSLSPGGPVILGPLVSTSTLAAGSGTPLGVLWKGGTNLGYVAAGTNFYSWDGTTFSSTGLGLIGGVSTDVPLVFRGVQTGDYWYVPVGVGAAPRYSTDSGATWAAVTTTGGFDKARCLIVHDGEVIFAGASLTGQGNARLARFDDGGTNPTVFGVIDPVGDPSFSIERLLIWNGRIVIFKPDEGVFLLARDRHTLAERLVEWHPRAAHRGFGCTVWRGILWIPSPRGLHAIGTHPFGHRPIVQNVGPEQSLSSVPWANHGQILCVAGDSWNLYAVLYMPATYPNPWLLKATVTVSGGTVSDIRWHPILRLAQGNEYFSLSVSEPGGNGPRLLAPRSATVMDTAILPANGRDPRADSNYRYAAGGDIFMSRLTARFPNLLKTFLGVTSQCFDLGRTLDGITSTAAQSVEAIYKLDTTALTSSNIFPWGYTEGAVRTSGVGATDSFALRSRSLDVAARLGTTDGTTTPQLRSLTVSYVLQPAPVWQHEIVVELSPAGLSGSAEAGADAVSPEVGLEALRLLPSAASFSFIDPINPNVSRTVVCPPNGVEPTVVGPPSGATNDQIPLRVKVLMVETTPPSAWV